MEAGVIVLASLYYTCGEFENPNGNRKKLFIRLCSTDNKSAQGLKYSAKLGDVIVGKKDNNYELRLCAVQNEKSIDYDAFVKCLDCVRSIAIKHNADVYMEEIGAEDDWYKIVNIIISILISRNVNVVVCTENIWKSSTLRRGKKYGQKCNSEISGRKMENR